MYRIPIRVATTTALAAGGLQPVGGLSPIPAGASFQDVFDTSLVALGPGASTVVAWPAVPAGQAGVVTHLALTTSDPANVTFQTRINGVGVSPYAVAHVGELGSLLVPFALPEGVKLNAGDVFDIVVSNPTGAGVTFQTRSMGAFFA